MGKFYNDAWEVLSGWVGSVSVALLLVAAAQSPVYSQVSDFGTVETFRCDFTESEGRRTNPSGVSSSADAETFDDLVVDGVDYEQATARFVGNAGSETVILIDGDRLVSFLERTGTGNVNILSIVKTAVGLQNYRAVYSRHTAFTTGDVTFSQSYGTCRGLI